MISLGGAGSSVLPARRFYAGDALCRQAKLLFLVAKRVALGFGILWLLSLLIFVGTEIMPGDVATAILGAEASPGAIATIRRSLNLDDPAPVRYVRWLSGMARGDMGKSLANGEPVAELVLPRLAKTLSLAGLAAAVVIPLSLLIAITLTIWRHPLVERAFNIITLTLISLPEFLIGYLLVLVFAVHLHWFPAMSLLVPGTSVLQQLDAMTLPAATLVFAVMAHIVRMTRTALIETMSTPFIEMAVLKGLPTSRVVLVHALPNAIAPILNVIGFSLAYCVVGVVVIEAVFVYPGVGQLMVDAVSRHDLPVVQACGLIFGATYVFINLLIDLWILLTNPLIRTPR